jgi:hypothetical protein
MLLGSHHNSKEERLRRVAQRIDALVEKDEARLRRAADISRLRVRAGLGLHAICASFTAAVNAMLTRGLIELDPPQFDETMFRHEALNLFQLNARGRIVQIAFEGTPETVSTEEFRIPYVLRGTVRAFNQELLEHSSIDEQLLFYTLEKSGSQWRYFDPRTYRSGAFDEEYLTGLVETLL